MSLLDHGPGYEQCTVFLEVTATDVDGNTVTRESSTGVQTWARFQIQGQSGTSSRRREQDNEGFESEKVYRIRFPRSFPHTLGAQSQIEWRGKRWSLAGDVDLFTSSPRTAHQVYTIKRY